MKLRSISFILLSLILVIPVLASACTRTLTITKTETSTTTETVTLSPVSGYQIGIATYSQNGNSYLTDSAGRSLYYNALDTPGASTVSGDTLTQWPVFYVADITLVPPGLNASDFTTVKRGDNTFQTALNGHPLYYYAGDTSPGNTFGNGSGLWHLAEIFYLMLPWYGE